jgi:ferredoxin
MDRVLGWILRQAEVTPAYHPERCLATKATGCRVCADVCPHEAIVVRRRVEIDPVDCTGCGICVAACPSQALTPRGAPAPSDVSLRCSRVAGSAPSVICLARLMPTDLLRLSDDAGTVRLGRAACEACDVGGPAVPELLERSAEHARALAATVGRELRVSITVAERLDDDRPERHLSRREMLRSGGDRARRATASALAPLERLAGADEDEAASRPALPPEWLDRLELLTGAGLAEASPVPVRLPEVLDGCLLCPACTAACPTDAIQRRFDDDGSITLTLEPRRCVGCDACEQVCPVDVVRMDEPVSWGRVNRDRTVLASRPAVSRPAGTTPR